MESAEMTGMDLHVAKVLAAGSANGHRVQLLECRDGSFVITCDGVNEVVFPVGICNLESCIKSYLAILVAFAEIVQPTLIATIDV